MTTNNAMVTTDKKSQPIQWSPEQIDLIKNTVAKGATDDELKLFLAVSQRSGLDPFTKQVHFVKRRTWNKDKKQYEEVGTIQTGIDGYRAIAARTGQHAGTDDAVIDEANNLPIKATVTVYRMVQNERVGFTASARFSEYRQMYQDKNGDMVLSGQWKDRPFLMISKCAESLALRKAFPNDLSGIYTEEEMGEATIKVVDSKKPRAKKEPENVIEATVIAPSEDEKVTVNSKKSRIQLLMKQLGLQPAENTAAGWKEAIKKSFNMELEEANYDAIIGALEATAGEPPDQDE